MSDQQEPPPRGTDWEKDGIGITDNGHVIFRNGDLCIAFTRDYVLDLNDRLMKADALNYQLNQSLNLREPSRIIPDAAVELSKRAAEADELRSDSKAGRVMAGCALAYRDAAAYIMGFIK